MVKLSRKLSDSLYYSRLKYCLVVKAPLKPSDVIAAVCALEDELERVKGERDAYKQEIRDRANTEASLVQNLYDCIGGRDALAAKLENAAKVTLQEAAADFGGQWGAGYKRAMTLAYDWITGRELNAQDKSSEKESEVKNEADAEEALESVHEDVINQRIATALEACIEPLYTELEHGDAGHRIWLRAKFEDWFRKRVATYGVPTKGERSAPSGTPPKTEPQGNSEFEARKYTTSSVVAASTPFTIAGPGFYRQRDGEKAEVTLYEPENTTWPYWGKTARGITEAWKSSGAVTWAEMAAPADLVAPWVEPAAPAPAEEEFEVVEREVVWYGLAGESQGNKDFEGCAFADWFDAQTWETRQEKARATVQFRIPRPKVVKPKVAVNRQFATRARNAKGSR